MNFFKVFFRKIKSFYYRIFPPDEDKYYRNNPSQEYLFIGGFHNKIKIKIPDNQEIVRLFNNQIYYKKILSTRNTKLAIYVLDKIPEYDILDRLVENYGRKNK